MTRTWTIAAAALTLLIPAGCGRQSEIDLAPVSGSVTYKGQPLAEGTITFYPAKGRPAYGKIENGKILEVTTLAKGDGVTAGTSEVIIQSFDPPPDMYATPKPRIPLRYSDPKVSNLKADVKQGQKNSSLTR